MSEHEVGKSEEKSLLASKFGTTGIENDDEGQECSVYVIPVHYIPVDQMQKAVIANDDRCSDEKMLSDFPEFLQLQDLAPLIAKLAVTSYANFNSSNATFFEDSCRKTLMAARQEGSHKLLLTKKDLNFVINFAHPNYIFGKGSSRMSRKIEISEVLSCEFVNQPYYNSATQRMLYMACRWFGIYGAKIETPLDLHYMLGEVGFMGNGYEDYAHSIVKLIIGRPLSQEELPR